MDASDRSAMLTGVNRPIVAADKLDITDDIIQLLAAKSGKK